MPLPPGPTAHPAIQLVRWIRRPIDYLEACRRRYGETFTGRFAGGETIVITSEPAVIKAALAQRATLSDSRRTMLEPVMGPRSVLLAPDGAHHLERRKLILPAFRGERMRVYEALVEELAAVEVESWPLGEPFETYDRMRALTREIMLRVLFGIEDPERQRRLRRLVDALFTKVNRPHRPIRALLTRQLGVLTEDQEFIALRGEADALVKEEIAARRSSPDLERREDILSLLLCARFEDGSAMDDDDLRDQLFTLLHAGNEPSAAGLAWAFNLVLGHPEAARLIGEQGDDYAQAVARETLRIRPPILGVGRELGAPARLNGSELARGTKTMLCAYMAHTRPDLHPDPYEFKPERFLDRTPPAHAWFPFGGGNRRCIGASLAELQMRVTLRTMFARAKLRRATEKPEKVKLMNVILAPRSGSPVVLEARR